MNDQLSALSTQQPTFRKVNADKVFACNGYIVHVWPGRQLLKTGSGYVCPTCGAAVEDVSGSLLGQSYWAFVRADLGRTQND